MLRSMFIGNHRWISSQIRSFLLLRLAFALGTLAADPAVRQKITPNKAESPNRQKYLVVIGKSSLPRRAACPRIAAAFSIWSLEQGGYIGEGMLSPLPFLSPASLNTPEIGGVQDAQKRAHSIVETGPNFPSKRPNFPHEEDQISPCHALIESPDWLPLDTWPGCFRWRSDA